MLPPKAHRVSAYETRDQKTGRQRPPTVVGHSFARVRRNAEARNSGECLHHDMCWHFGAPWAGNANFAWVQHIDHHGAASGSSGALTIRRFGVA